MIGSWFYAGILVLGVALWPPVVFECTTTVGAILTLANLALLVLVWRSCSTEAVSFWQGLNIISESMMSGCANITILYAFPVLTLVYILSVVFAFQGVLRGRELAGQRWERLVVWFYDRSLRSRHNQ